MARRLIPSWRMARASGVLCSEGHQVLLDARARPTGLDRDSSDASRLVEREHDFELAGFSTDRPLPPKFTLQAG